ISGKYINIVTTKDKTEKQMRRKYSPRGTRRDSSTIRVDNDTRHDLHEIAGKLGLPVIEVMRLAVEKLKSETANESE
ncbi:MAG TPA: hypothetical protein PLE32_21180, partial [Haliscomenobacter sp.]|nr:hypothetical protein [Haliscomenobacter sp.]